MKIPESFLNCPVALYLPIPIPGPNGKGIGFPSIEATILEDHGAYLVVQEKGNMLPSLWPIERVQKIDKVSNLVAPPAPLLIMR